MCNMIFSAEEKIAMFDKIASRFYQQNFGETSKADMELLMFHFYIEKLITQYQEENGTIDYNKSSDYKISRALGITQQQVRNLKVKKQLKYPVPYEWQKALAKLLPSARKESNKIAIYIPDPNLYIEIENFIAERGAYIEKTFNNKVLKMRLEYFIELSIETEESTSRKEIIKNLKKQIKETNKNEGLFDERHIGRSLIEMGINITTLVANLTTFISPQNFLLSEFFKFFKNN